MGSCNCNNGCNEAAARRALREATCSIQEGIKLCCEALNALARGNECDCIRLLREGLCALEKGLCDLIEAINALSFDENCRTQRLVQEAICDIKTGIRQIQEGLDMILDCNLRAGANLVRRGIRSCESGLCETLRAIEDAF